MADRRAKRVPAADISEPGLKLQTIHRQILETVRLVGKGWEVHSTRLLDIEVIKGNDRKERHVVGYLDITIKKK